MGNRTVHGAVVGAGIAGLAVARSLARRGLRVVVFDKGRAPGGRLSTRRRMLDHGAPCFSVRDVAFAEAVAQWEEAGVVERWPRRVRGGPSDGVPRYRGAPHMASLAAHLADGLAVRSGVRLTRAVCGAEGWELADATGAAYGPFETLAVTVPAPQAVALLDSVPDLRRSVAGVRMDPCWAGLFSFDEPLGPEYDAAFPDEGGVAFVSRRARGAGEAWVVHADPAWSAERIDAPPGEVAAALRARLADLAGRALPAARYERAHLWRFARVREPLGEACLWDPLRRVGFAGDGCLGGNVEGAWRSGRALAAAILA